MTVTAAGRLAVRVPTLLRDTAFRRYWGAQTVSMFGDQISAVALPLAAVLVLRATPAEMGYLSALVWLPSLLFALHAGVWVDRRGHRRLTMVAADLGRAVLLGSIPVACALGGLTMAQVFLVAFAAGTLSTFFTVSDGALFVSLVGQDDYVAGNSLVYQSRALSFVAGPSLGGLLVQLLSAPFALAADALSFLGSAFFLGRIRAAEPPAEPASRSGGLAAGARFVWRSAILRPVLACIAMINFFSFMFAALLVLYATRYLHVRPGELGLILGAGAVGGVLGSLVTQRLAARAGLGRAYLVGCIGYPAPLLLVPLASGPRPVVLGLLLAAEFISGFGVMILDISIGAIFAAHIPNRLRSRVAGAFQTVNYGARPVGALAGGALGTLIGPRPTLWIAAAGGSLGFLWLLPSPLRRRDLPGPAAEPDQ